MASFWRQSALASVCIAYVLFGSTSALNLGGTCTNPHNQPGKCIPFRECDYLQAFQNKSIITPDDMSFIQSSKCGWYQRKALVCCPVPRVHPPSTQCLPEPPTCGKQLQDRIVQGQPTDIDEFPWTALIEYQKPDGRFGFHCGGSLINTRYIVTAAHCVILSGKSSWRVYRVRLGEWDLAKFNDCDDGYCSDTPIDLDIEEIIAHEEYDPRDPNHVNDIALIRVDRHIQYTNFVKPICLPLSFGVQSKNYVGTSTFAAGWGRTESASASNLKLKVELTVRDHEACSAVYSRNGVFLQDSQLCAGSIHGKDTCSGDSGGPLMQQVLGAWYLLGIVSFGPTKCGTPSIPGIYTNPIKYVDWIKENVKC